MRIIHDTKRPMLSDYIETLFDDFIELHGDRYFADDHAIMAGIGWLNGTPVTVIGHRKGRTIEQNMDANFGMANPEGYRKALRLAHREEKFRRPVIILWIPRAHTRAGAEERGQGEAIARCLYEFIELKTPVISIVTGEGGSGGALALAVADRVLMLENAIYSVVSPRGCASILWKDPTREGEVADARITAQDLYESGMIEASYRRGSRLTTDPQRGPRRATRLRNWRPSRYGYDAAKRSEKFRKIGSFQTNKQEEIEGV